MSHQDSPQVPTQEEYAEQTSGTRWVDLPEGPGQFQVREMKPLALLRAAEEYQVQALLAEDVTDDDVDDLADGDLAGFMEDVICPNIAQPAVYWSDPTEGDFDLAEIHQDDLMAVIVGMTGQDPSALQEAAEQDGDDRFPGERHS